MCSGETFDSAVLLKNERKGVRSTGRDRHCVPLTCRLGLISRRSALTPAIAHCILRFGLNLEDPNLVNRIQCTHPTQRFQGDVSIKAPGRFTHCNLPNSVPPGSVLTNVVRITSTSNRCWCASTQSVFRHSVTERVDILIAISEQSLLYV
jgi:hypothetical protein